MPCGHKPLHVTIGVKRLSGNKFEPVVAHHIGPDDVHALSKHDPDRGQIFTVRVPPACVAQVGDLHLVATCECGGQVTSWSSVLPRQMPGHDLYYTIEHD